MPLTHLAMAFAIAHPGVTSALVGPRTMEQLDDLLAGFDVALTDEILDVRVVRREHCRRRADRIHQRDRIAGRRGRPGREIHRVEVVEYAEHVLRRRPSKAFSAAPG